MRRTIEYAPRTWERASIDLFQVAVFLGTGDEVDEDFAVHGGLEDGPLRFEAVFQLQGIHQVAVVGDGHEAPPPLGQKRLGVLQEGRAGCGVPYVPHRRIPGELLQDRRVEDIAHQSHPFVDLGFLPVGGDDPRALLTPVLQGIETQIGKMGSLRMPEDPEHPAFFARKPPTSSEQGHACRYNRSAASRVLRTHS